MLAVVFMAYVQEADVEAKVTKCNNLEFKLFVCGQSIQLKILWSYFESLNKKHLFES